MNAVVRGWIPVADKVPPVGERVRVRHALNRSYDCTGRIEPDGNWSCSNAFILPTNPPMLVWNPTHWMPLDAESAQ